MKHLIHSGHRRLSNPHDPEESRGGPADSRCGYFDVEGDRLVGTLAELLARDGEESCGTCYRAEVSRQALVKDHAKAITRRGARRRFAKRFR